MSAGGGCVKQTPQALFSACGDRAHRTRLVFACIIISIAIVWLSARTFRKQMPIMPSTYVLSGRDPQGTKGIIKINSRDVALRILESWKTEGFTEVDLAETEVEHAQQPQHVSSSGI